MPRYLVEAYAAERHDEELTLVLQGARLIQSLYVPEDELYLYLFEADSVADVRRAAAHAKLLVDRVRAVES
jgi:hypothetical protein